MRRFHSLSTHSAAITRHPLMSFISLALLALCFLTAVTQVEAEKKNDDNKVANQLKERNDDSKSGNSDHEMPSSRCYESLVFRFVSVF